MALFETWLTQDKNTPVQVTRLPGDLFSGDRDGNLIGVSVVNNGTAVTLSGTCMAYIIRADGQTIEMQGTVSGNKASVVLPSSAYIIVGPISIVLKVDNVTVAACATYVHETATDTVIDEDNVIPSLEDVYEKLSNLDSAVTTAQTAASNAASSASAASSSATSAGQSATSAGNSATAAEAVADCFNNVVTVTGAAGTNASVSIDRQNETITFTIPRGANGTNGADGTVITVEGISADSNHDISLYSLIASTSEIESMVAALFA